uniref:(California timema) hypothetical protein n=1 Tax=Timema californicum TaxID=61474 RepID=A0A7R9P870_TIMCA|nr:unnamed protein product [Timema californicum]
MAIAFHRIQEELQMLADEDPDEERSARVHRTVMEGLTCYQEIYKEKKHSAKQPTIRAFFQPVVAMMMRGIRCGEPLGGLLKVKEGEKSSRRKEKQKAKADEKQVKRRQKEEKLKKLADKEKEREKKKTKHKNKLTTIHQPVLQDFVQSDENSIPLLLEKCVKFIEEEGLDSEGIYRVPGNRAHVDLLFHKFEEDPGLNIRDLDIPVNAVATALKDFFSKRLPPLLTQDMMAELEDISETHLDDLTPFLVGNFEKELSLDIPLQMRTSPHYWRSFLLDKNTYS